MLSAFDEFGNLPHGIHNTTISEIELRYCWNERRRLIFVQMVEWMKHMRAAGCRIVYIDGSFVTMKELPSDFDACYDTRGVDAALLDSVLTHTDDGMIDRIKARFGGDIRTAYECPEGSIATYLQYFMLERYTFRPKGIVCVDLSRECI